MTVLLNTRYRKSIKTPNNNMLKPGANNKKLGSVVSVTKWKHCAIYSLTLEERATCPRTCEQWDNCYGNNMPFAHRFDHTDKDFLKLLEENVDDVCLKHPEGVLLRLHVLGDFFSVEYVKFWARMLGKHDNLHIFGYTHHDPEDSIIGFLIDAMNVLYEEQFAVRFSDSGKTIFSAHVIKPDQRARTMTERPQSALICPEQDGKTSSCATCGLCWSAGNRSIFFLEH